LVALIVSPVITPETSNEPVISMSVK
jgi:hypothetical protein